LSEEEIPRPIKSNNQSHVAKVPSYFCKLITAQKSTEVNGKHGKRPHEFAKIGSALQIIFSVKVPSP
jgi:hypothetical protein